MRTPLLAVAAGVLVAAVGAAGLVRAAVPQSAAGAGSSPAGVAPIVVTGAYVRPPLPPTTTAAAYFTVRNTTDTPDVLTQVITGAGTEADLHTVQPDGSMAVDATGLPIPAHGTVRLSPGKGHVMIENVIGTLAGGQTVNMALTFRNAGTVQVQAAVVPWSQPAPDAGSTGGARP